MRYWYFFFIGIIAILVSCEDVIEVDTPSEPPRLNVEAVFRVDITEEFIPVEVKVTETNNFFGEVPVTSLENIIIVITLTDSLGIGSSGVRTLAESEPGSGIYIPDPNFSSDQRIPTSAVEFDLRYDLIIEHKGRKYIAQTKYVPAVPIDVIVQGNGTLFSANDTEVIITYNDDPNRDDYYIFDFDFNEYLVSEDTFYQGQEFIFSYFYDRKFETGKEIEISILGADETFYNYMNQLIEQTDGQQGPFQTPVATVRGNVFDITGLDNIDIFDNAERPEAFPLGYFAIVQEFKRTITFQ
ncbi:MAG: DUF4249 domain-containing protein [Maribacter sp.]|nr:DUF4249 domain-containing protein [Maribacter sp.]